MTAWRLCIAMVIAAVATMAGGEQSTLDFSHLMAMLAKVDRSVVAFQETRYFAVLAAPLVRRGTMQYVRPDRLEMDVVAPFPETLEIRGDKVRISSADGKREWDLARQPVAVAWVEALRASLAGDTATLERLFRVTLTGTAATWNLRLEPRDAQVAARLSRVELRGRQAQVTGIEIIDRQGDRIVIVLAPSERSIP